MKKSKFIDGNEMSTSANIQEWIDSCQLAGYDDLFFQRFRSSPAFLDIVEGTPKIRFRGSLHTKFNTLWAISIF